MRIQLAIVALALALHSAPAAAQDWTNPEASRIDPRPPRNKALEPLARKAFDRAVTRLFAGGDRDRDGTITLAELNAAIDASKAEVVARRFAAVDSDRNQAISYAEFVAWQTSLGSAVLDEGTSGGRPLSELVAEELRIDFGDSAEARTLDHLVEPLNSVVLANANTDYDGGVSEAELVAYEGRLFERADGNKDGWITPDESDALIARAVGP
jgi:hypothetical protein